MSCRMRRYETIARETAARESLSFPFNNLLRYGTKNFDTYPGAGMPLAFVQRRAGKDISPADV